MTQMMKQMTIPRLDETTLFDSAQRATVAGRYRWPMVKLGDLCDPVKGVLVSFFNQNDKFEYIDIASIDRETKRIVKASTIASKEAPSRAKQPVSNGDILISTVRPNLNAVAMVNDYHDGAIASSGFCILRPLRTKILPEYLFFFTRSNNFVDYLNNLATGASYPAVSDKIVKSAQIPLPPLPEQHRIVARLDKAQQLIDQRKEQLKLMDALVQSLFYEMFGDEISLRTNYEHVSMNSLGISATSGKSVSGEGRPALEHELGVLKVSAVTKGVFNQNENKAVSQMPEGQLIFPKAGDVLVTRANTRELVAACCVVNQDFHNIFLPDKIWRINLNESLSNWFFKFIINVSYIRNEIIGKASGTSGSMLNISQQNFLETKIPLPPLSLQQAFADRVQQIEVLKQSMTASLRELEHNFNALMQEAFGG